MGVMFLGATNRHFVSDFDKIHVPSVIVTNDASDLPFENLSSVTTNDRQGAACARYGFIYGDLGVRFDGSCFY